MSEYLGPDSSRYAACNRCDGPVDPYEDFCDPAQIFGAGVTIMKRRIGCPACHAIITGLTQ